MPVEDIASAIELIKAWVTQHGISEGVETKPTPDGFSFHFTGKGTRDIPFTILQPEAWKRTVLILSEVTIAEDDIKYIKSMRPGDRDKFLYNLQKDIMFTSTHFALSPDFEKTGIPSGIQFSKEICYDGLTEDRLNNAIGEVIKNVIFVIWSIRKEFGNTGQ